MRDRIRPAAVVVLDGGEIRIDVDTDGVICIADPGELLGDGLKPDEVWAFCEALQDMHRVACERTEERADERAREAEMRQTVRGSA